jgi:AbrB family looped-hinge helix DNA binding protein
MISVGSQRHRLSSRGQVVIPRMIRERPGIEEGTGLLVFRVGDSIILKSTSEATAGGLASSLQATRRKIVERRITRKDVSTEVSAARKRR